MNRAASRTGPAMSCELRAGTQLPQEGVEASIACASCGAEAPASTATALEGADYLWHFFGHDCFSHWCKRADAVDTGGKFVHEGGRIQFLLDRDGLEATIAWVRRALRIYRAAVRDKNHFAHSDAFRRRFIHSYRDFKRWLAGVHGHRPSRGRLIVNRE